MKNIQIQVEIIEWIDNHQPGFVKCRLIDAWGKVWHFRDKLPIFTNKDLNDESNYPQHGELTGIIIKKWIDETGREIITIDTEKPFCIESDEGYHYFDVLQNQIIET